MFRVLCVCLGNGDRSPAMAGVLNLFLKETHPDVVCESAGVLDSLTEGDPAAPLAVEAARRIGIDLSGHRRHHISSLNLANYDLLVCVDDQVAAQLIQAGSLPEKLYNANVPNPWPVQFQEDYDRTFEHILATMYHVITHYFR